MGGVAGTRYLLNTCNGEAVGVATRLYLNGDPEMRAENVATAPPMAQDHQICTWISSVRLGHCRFV
jgi:hypothetical protein